MTKICVLCPFWQRPEITRYFIEGFKRLKKYDFELIGILSKEDPFYKENYELLKEYNLCEYTNYPLGEKMNAGINYALTFEWDYLMNIGSDDIIDTELFDFYEPYINAKSPMFGIVQSYFYELYYKNLYFVTQVDASFPHGGARMIRRDIIEQVTERTDVYINYLNSGLDTESTKAIVHVTGIQPEIVRTGKRAYIMDIKTLININQMKKIRQHCHKLTNIESIMDNFDFKPDCETHDISKIVNFRISNSVIFFKDGFRKRWNLREDHNPDLPLIVFGCYIKADVDFVLYHARFIKVVVVWAGSDSIRIENLTRIREWKHTDNIYHIASSKWIAEDLEKAGLKYKFLPISVNTYDDLKPCKLGSKIYIYTSETNPSFYGEHIYKKLFAEFGKDKFIVADYKTFDRKELIKAYTDSFIGLRLVGHDGLSETVIELGMMGRRVIYNGKEPNALGYRSYNDIVEIIRTEMANKMNLGLAKQMKDYIDIGNDWLKVSSYQ